MGKTADSAMDVFRHVKALEEIGCFGAEWEVVPDRVAGEINQRTTLVLLGIGAGPPSARRGRRNPADHDTSLYRKRHRIENLFARLKDWRRIATRYDKCGDLFLSAICIAATVIFWL